MALGALDAARALGVRVPDDLAVVGMDDTPMAAWPAYRLTTWGIAPDAIADIMVRSTLAPQNGMGGEDGGERSEEHTSELQSLMRISYAVFCLKKKKTKNNIPPTDTQHSKN